jgi:thioredoxin-dependent peroxiredoxin
MTDKLQPGNMAPAFTLADGNGRKVSLSDFADGNVVVYFYPKAATPGCTTEACDFRDNLNSLQGAGYAVVGISPDEPEAIADFAADQRLNFPLLSDPDHAVAKAWGAFGEKEINGRTSTGTLRSTVVLGPGATVRSAEYNVTAQGHVARLRTELGI